MSGANLSLIIDAFETFVVRTALCKEDCVALLGISVREWDVLVSNRKMDDMVVLRMSLVLDIDRMMAPRFERTVYQSWWIKKGWGPVTGRARPIDICGQGVEACQVFRDRIHRWSFLVRSNSKVHFST